MEIIQFDISGKFAHFRKYYANNTALTYSLPPRTTVIGMLAAILGRPRDSYYEEFSSDKIRIGIAIKSPLKKNIHRLNFLSIKSLGDLKKSFESDFRGMAGNPIQTPFEVVTGLNLQSDDVCYRIFVASNISGDETFQAVKNVLLNGSQVYSLTLGTANFNSSISQVICYKNDQIAEQHANNEFVNFDSAVISDSVNEISFSKDEQLMNFIEEELLPADFIANNNREISKMNRVLYTTAGVPLSVKFSGNFYVLSNQSITQVVQFLE